MHASSATDRTIAPYNTAYLRDDRTRLYEEFGIDPEQDGGTPCPDTGERDAPGDFTERRAAILSFYGERCGRCLAAIGATSVGDRELGYLYTVADAIGATDRWALEHLVPVCEPCYEVLSIEDAERLDALGSAYRRSQQFPQWLGDPRVAVERIPLTGRELWIRERLESRGSGRIPVPEDPVNEPIARQACLARKTPASKAIDFGERLAADAWQPIPSDQRLTERWGTLTETNREEYERRAEHWRELIAGSFVPAKR